MEGKTSHGQDSTNLEAGCDLRGETMGLLKKQAKKVQKIKTEWREGGNRY